MVDLLKEFKTSLMSRELWAASGVEVVGGVSNFVTRTLILWCHKAGQGGNSCWGCQVLPQRGWRGFWQDCCCNEGLAPASLSRYTTQGLDDAAAIAPLNLLLGAVRNIAEIEKIIAVEKSRDDAESIITSDCYDCWRNGFQSKRHLRSCLLEKMHMTVVTNRILGLSPIFVIVMSLVYFYLYLLLASMRYQSSLVNDNLFDKGFHYSIWRQRVCQAKYTDSHCTWWRLETDYLNAADEAGIDTITEVRAAMRLEQWDSDYY